MRTKLSIAVILFVVAAVAYAAISGNERTFTQGRGAGRGNVMGGGGAGRGMMGGGGAGRGMMGGGGAGRGIMGGGGAGRGMMGGGGAGRGMMGGGGAGRGGAQGCSDCDSGGQSCGSSRDGHSCDSGRDGHSCDSGRGGHSYDSGRVYLPHPGSLAATQRGRGRQGGGQGQGANAPRRGMGQMTLSELCQNEGIELTWAIRRLRNERFAAQGTMTIREIADGAGVHPRELRDILGLESDCDHEDYKTTPPHSYDYGRVGRPQLRFR